MPDNIVKFKCDGDKTIGLGHARRTHSLAWECKKAGLLVDVDCGSINEEDTGLYFPHDKGPPGLAVIDLPNEADKAVKFFSDLKIKTLALDYFKSYEPSAVINIHEHFSSDLKCLRYSGYKYMIVRPEILSLRTEPYMKCGEGVIVMMGGADTLGLGDKVARILYDLGEEVTLIVGPLTKDKAAAAGLPYRRLYNPENLPSLMASCKWAVTNGGGSMFEMMCLGKAVHVIPQSDFEENFAVQFLSLKALLGLGLPNLHQPNELSSETTSLAAHRIADGKGLYRILEIIKTMLSEE